MLPGGATTWTGGQPAAMDREAFARQMRRLLAAYNREMRAPVLDVWYEAMKDFEGSDLAFQVDRAISACKMPVLGEMLAGMKDRAQERLGRQRRGKEAPQPATPPAGATSFGREAAGIVAELCSLTARRWDMNPSRQISDDEVKVAIVTAKAKLIEAAVRHEVDTREWAYAPAADPELSAEMHKAYQAAKAFYDSRGRTALPSFRQVQLLNPDWLEMMNRRHDGAEIYTGERRGDGIPHEQGDPDRQRREGSGAAQGGRHPGGELLASDDEGPPW